MTDGPIPSERNKQCELHDEWRLIHGDHYMHLADLASYCPPQNGITALYSDPAAWDRKAILKVASSGKFSSDRTIAEYTRDIWRSHARFHKSADRS